MSTHQTTPGIAWTPWMVNPSQERLDAYEVGEVRYRLVGNIAHIALLDENMAKDIDRQEEAAGR